MTRDEILTTLAEGRAFLEKLRLEVRTIITAAKLLEQEIAPEHDIIQPTNLSMRAFNAIVDDGIITWTELAKQDYRHLLILRNFGKTSLREVETALGLRGMRLAVPFYGAQS